MDAIAIYNKIKHLQEDKKLSNRKLCELAGVSHSALDNWKRRQIIPSVPILENLCEVLGISLAQLFVFENIEDLTEDEKTILEMWSTLKYGDKKMVFDLIRNMRSKY